MHMADALLSPGTAAAMYTVSAATMIFAGQMINYTIPGTGSSGHLCGGMLLSALIGLHAGFLAMIA